MSEEWLTARQVANELGVTYHTVLRWLKNGDLSGERIGPRVFRVRRSALDEIAR